MSEVAGHVQAFTHRYRVTYPDHFPRAHEPHYRDFDAYHRKNGPTARCALAERWDLAADHGVAPTRQAKAPHRLIGVGEGYAGCDTDHPIELHHSHIEYAVANNVSLVLLEHDYEGVSDPDSVGAWVESGANFVWLCVFHHRTAGGAHTASASDYEAERYVRGLIQPY